MSNCQSVLSSCTGWVSRVYNMALSKLIDFSLKISFADCMDYGLEKVSKATSAYQIELIKTFADRAFSVSALTLWNQLPEPMQNIHDPLSFKKAVKTHLFKEAFPAG